MRPVGIANASGQQAMGVDLNAAVPIAVELASKLLQEIERKNENGINRIKTWPIPNANSKTGELSADWFQKDIVTVAHIWPEQPVI